MKKPLQVIEEMKGMMGEANEWDKDWIMKSKGRLKKVKDRVIESQVVLGSGEKKKNFMPVIY